MSFLSHPEIIGFAGVALLLVAFFLNLFRLLSARSVLYLALNLVGAGLACASSYLIDFMPFVLLEGTWAIVAAGALVRKIRVPRRPGNANGSACTEPPHSCPLSPIRGEGPGNGIKP